MAMKGFITAEKGKAISESVIINGIRHKYDDKEKTLEVRNFETGKLINFIQVPKFNFKEFKKYIKHIEKYN